MAQLLVLVLTGELYHCTLHVRCSTRCAKLETRQRLAQISCRRYKVAGKSPGVRYGNLNRNIIQVTSSCSDQLIQAGLLFDPIAVSRDNNNIALYRFI